MGAWNYFVRVGYVAVVAAAAMSHSGAQPLPGTAPLEEQRDFAAEMVNGIHRYLDRETAASVARREGLWQRDYRSREAYEKSVAEKRARLRRIIGAVDDRVAYDSPALESSVGHSSLVAMDAGFQVHAVRWPVFSGVDAEGLLLEPTKAPACRVVAVPDAGWTPEMIAGLAPGLAPEAQYARRLAGNGCLVLVPVLIDRRDTWSQSPRGRTNQPHREFVYRMAFEMGRHIIGYEVQKVMAAVDWFARQGKKRPIGVAGYGEGGLIALYSAALDPRIDVAAVSGYFQPREMLWHEPIYRDIWGLLREFGDAEIASLVATRGLVIINSKGPEIAGPPPEIAERKGAASGSLSNPAPEAVAAEVGRARPYFEKLDAANRLVTFIDKKPGDVPLPGPALAGFLRLLGVNAGRDLAAAPKDLRGQLDPDARQKRQFLQLVDYTQSLVRRSEFTRRDFWARADSSSVDRWRETSAPYRRYLREEVVGKLPDPSEPLAARTRRIYDEEKWTGYEAMLPVWPEVYAYGILLVPKDLKPGERRPVVVCQHGLEGRPQDLVRPENNFAEEAYARFAAKLADRGFVVYAPQNPYIGGDRFRQIQRKAHPLQLSLFSFIVGQHQRTLEWLSQLPFVDENRIGFYGLSYGGKTAMRVPALLEKYAFSICSADFNEWVWKVTDVDHSFSYMFTNEYDMLEFDFGNTFNYSDLASLIAPRPFMVERGHHDGVGIDEWVAYEYAPVRRLYAALKIPERTEIEFFDGPHQIHGVGTFRFVEEWLGGREWARGDGDPKKTEDRSRKSEAGR